MATVVRQLGPVTMPGWFIYFVSGVTAGSELASALRSDLWLDEQFVLGLSPGVVWRGWKKDCVDGRYRLIARGID